MSEAAGRAQSCLRNRMREFLTSGSVGGVGGDPGSYPATVTLRELTLDARIVCCAGRRGLRLGTGPGAAHAQGVGSQLAC